LGAAVVIVDSHCHAGVGDRIAGPWITDAPLRSYLRRAEAARITRTVLFAPLSQDYDSANHQVALIVRQSPARFMGFVFLHPVADHGRVAQTVATAVDEWGFRGIKVHWRDGRMTREIAEVARARRMPILYDPGGDTDAVEAMARTYTDVDWIIPHLSSFADDWKAQVAFVDLLSLLPNVFTDTSGVRYFDILADAVRRAGAAKILFGSDGPFLHPGVELAKVFALALTPEERTLVLGGNLQRLVSRVRTLTLPERMQPRSPHRASAPGLGRGGDPRSSRPKSRIAR
jgi:predicted TIM-barrel fold metal-dependent hydrolase